MSSIQKFTASLLSGSPEATAALANLKFDFSLFKVEAPIEFKPLGRELSEQRRIAAEDGTPHITARKLGALFQRLLPSTPNLVRCYGRRASNIASSPLANPKGTNADGIFADQIGIDGTSIWAAATSGAESIAVHLLACMLARLWSGAEATSIWAELVAERKKELMKPDQGNLFHMSSLTTAQINLTRDQLAEWDASARAWLRNADEAQRFRQKQLMLIINNINIPVNRWMDVYPSVLSAWTSAMETTEKLISGMPQSVQDGGSFVRNLGLAPLP